MLQLCEKIQNVSSFIVIREVFLFAKGYDILDLNKEILFKSDIGLQGFKSHNGYILVLDIKGNSIIIDPCLKAIKIEKTIIYLDDKSLMLYQGSPGNRNSIVINKETGVTLGHISGRTTIYYFDDDLFFRYNFEKVSIECYSLPRLEHLWEKVLDSIIGSYVNYNQQPTTYKVSKFIGISGHQLLVVLNDRFILSLNVQTGELIKLVDVCAALELNPVSFGNMRPADVYLCPNRNQLLWLSFHYYIQIDTNTLEPRLVKHYALGDKSTWWNIKHSTLSDQFMVFNADYGDKRISPDHLGIANVDTGELMWSERIVNKGFLVNNPQTDGQKLYQLDNNGNLYVYGNVE